MQIERQKYVPMSQTLRKCKAIERKRDLKRERLLLQSPSAAPVQMGLGANTAEAVDVIKTMQDVKDRE